MASIYFLISFVTQELYWEITISIPFRHCRGFVFKQKHNDIIIEPHTCRMERELRIKHDAMMLNEMIHPQLHAVQWIYGALLLLGMILIYSLVKLSLYV